MIALLTLINQISVVSVWDLFPRICPYYPSFMADLSIVILTGPASLCLDMFPSQFAGFNEFLASVFPERLQRGLSIRLSLC